MRRQTGPGTKAFQEHPGFRPPVSTSSLSHSRWCPSAYSRKKPTLIIELFTLITVILLVFFVVVVVAAACVLSYISGVSHYNFM